MTESIENIHKYWHRYQKGMCLYCGYHCIDCPNDVASCKCTPKREHVFTDECRRKWCRIHWCVVWEDGEMIHQQYPLSFNIKTSEQGWIKVTVYCGPIAFHPKYDYTERRIKRDG